MSKKLETKMIVNGEGSAIKFYYAQDVDTILAEKDKEIALLKERICNGDVSRLTWIDTCLDQDKEIAELKAKLENVNELIKTARQMLEDAKATHYAEMVDAGMRERRLRRALWLARALRARDIQRWWIAATCAPITERACSVWNDVERKCLKKSKEYL